MRLFIKLERQDDGRWIAHITDMLGWFAYGATYHEAKAKMKSLAYRILADAIENGEHYDTGVEWYCDGHVPEGVEEMPQELRKLRDEAVQTLRKRLDPIDPGSSDDDVPRYPALENVLVELDSVRQFCDDVRAGRVERGVDSLAVGLAHARDFEPSEFVGTLHGDEDGE